MSTMLEINPIYIYMYTQTFYMWTIIYGEVGEIMARSISFWKFPAKLQTVNAIVPVYMFMYVCMYVCICMYVYVYK